MTDDLRGWLLKRVPGAAVVLAVCGALLTGCGTHTQHAARQRERQRALSAHANAMRKAQTHRQAALTARAATLLQKESPNFNPSPGWVVVRAGREQPYMSSAMVIAVTTPDLKAAHPFGAFTDLKQLSPHGILVWATTTTGHHLPTFTPMRWPPRLASFRLDHRWEGQPAANVQQRLKWGVINGWDVDVRVYFGTQRPDKKLLKEAQAQLDRLVLPHR